MSTRAAPPTPRRRSTHHRTDRAATRPAFAGTTSVCPINNKRRRRGIAPPRSAPPGFLPPTAAARTARDRARYPRGTARAHPRSSPRAPDSTVPSFTHSFRIKCCSRSVHFHFAIAVVIQPTIATSHPTTRRGSAHRIPRAATTEGPVPSGRDAAGTVAGRRRRQAAAFPGCHLLPMLLHANARRGGKRSPDVGGPRGRGLPWL